MSKIKFAGRGIYIFLLFIFPFFVYMPSLSYKNVYLDDNALTENSSESIKNIFAKDIFFGKDVKSGFYRPLMALSFYSDRKIAMLFAKRTDLPGNDKDDKSDKLPYGMEFVCHFTNIMLHSFFCLLLLKMLSSYGINYVNAYIASVFFAVLPYNATAVSWLGGRNDIILGIFISLPMILLKKFEQAAFPVNKEDFSVIKNNKNVYIEMLKPLAAMSVFFTFALFSKETAVSFVPAAVLAFIISLAFFHKENIDGDKFFHKRIKTYIAMLCVSLIIPLIVYFSFRMKADLAQNAFAHIDFHSIFRLPHIIAGYLLSMPVFLSLPKNLSFIVSYLILPAVFFVPVFLMRKPSRHIPNAITGMSVFLFFLIPPLLSTDSPDGWFYMRHRLYLPLSGLILYIVSFYENMLVSHKNIFMKKNFLMAFLSILFVFSAANSILDSMNFKNKLEFHSKQLEENRSKLGEYLNAAGEWYFGNQFDFSYFYYKKAREAGYETPVQYLHLSYMEMANGNLIPACEEIRQGLRKFPDDKYLKDNMEQFKMAGISADN